MTGRMDQVNVIVAHSLEARPLINRFELKPNKIEASLTVYSNDAGIRLIITGVGKQSSFAATNRLADLRENSFEEREGWLNVGIAGHKSAKIGAGLLANKIIDASSAKAVYPVPMLSDIPSSAVITVDQPDLDYCEEAAYEMEAFGFWSAVSNHTFLELIQIYKLISDNPEHPVNQLDPNSLEQLVANHCDKVERVVLNLQSLVREVNEIYRLPDECEKLQGKVRLSITQQHQLKRLCQRFLAFGLEKKLTKIIDEVPHTGKQLIQNLELELLSETRIK